MHGLKCQKLVWKPNAKPGGAGLEKACDEIRGVAAVVLDGTIERPDLRPCAGSDRDRHPSRELPATAREWPCRTPRRFAARRSRGADAIARRRADRITPGCGLVRDAAPGRQCLRLRACQQHPRHPALLRVPDGRRGRCRGPRRTQPGQAKPAPHSAGPDQAGYDGRPRARGRPWCRGRSPLPPHDCGGERQPVLCRDADLVEEQIAIGVNLNRNLSLIQPRGRILRGSRSIAACSRPSRHKTRTAPAAPCARMSKMPAREYSRGADRRDVSHAPRAVRSSPRSCRTDCSTPGSDAPRRSPRTGTFWRSPASSCRLTTRRG